MKRIFLLAFTLLLILGMISCKPSLQTPGEERSFAELNEAVSMVIIGQSSSYAQGETATEGHIILTTEEKGNKVKVYTIASYGAFGFENGIFTKISGSGAIPTVITFSRDESGNYSLLEYKEPRDGSEYPGSIKKMFPKRLYKRVLSSHEDYPSLQKQQEEQAKEYLKSIGITADVIAHVEKQLPDIDVGASNKLFAEFTKHDSYLNNFPYWLGTIEKVVGGVRYTYETSQEKTLDGYDLIIFRKKKDGEVIEQRKYKIIGSEPVLVEFDKTEAYLNVINKLYEEDTGLNGNIKYISIDTSLIVNLKDSEKEELLKGVEEYGFTVLNMTFRELEEKGYIKDVYFKEGILFEIRDKPIEGNSITMDISKWRSGLGAIGYDGLVISYKDGKWVIEKEGTAWIS